MTNYPSDDECQEHYLYGKHNGSGWRKWVNFGVDWGREHPLGSNGDAQDLLTALRSGGIERLQLYPEGWQAEGDQGLSSYFPTPTEAIRAVLGVTPPSEPASRSTTVHRPGGGIERIAFVNVEAAPASRTPTSPGWWWRDDRGEPTPTMVRDASEPDENGLTPSGVVDGLVFFHVGASAWRYVADAKWIGPVAPPNATASACADCSIMQEQLGAMEEAHRRQEQRHRELRGEIQELEAWKAGATGAATIGLPPRVGTHTEDAYVAHREAYLAGSESYRVGADVVSATLNVLTKERDDAIASMDEYVSKLGPAEDAVERLTRALEIAKQWVKGRDELDRGYAAADLRRIAELSSGRGSLQGDARDLHLRWNGTEWIDKRCGCRYHPDDDSGSHGGAPHVHLCERHASAQPQQIKGGDLPSTCIERVQDAYFSPSMLPESNAGTPEDAQAYVLVTHTDNDGSEQHDSEKEAREYIAAYISESWSYISTVKEWREAMEGVYWGRVVVLGRAVRVDDEMGAWSYEALPITTSEVPRDETADVMLKDPSRCAAPGCPGKGAQGFAYCEAHEDQYCAELEAREAAEASSSTRTPCEICDRPRATEADARRCNDTSDEMPELCWREFGNIVACDAHRVDWRARALDHDALFSALRRRSDLVSYLSSRGVDFFGLPDDNPSSPGAVAFDRDGEPWVVQFDPDGNFKHLERA